MTTRLTRRGLCLTAAAIALLSALNASTDDLPNAPRGHGACYEDTGCEDGTPWLCRRDGNRLCGAGIDNASVTR